MVRPTHYTDNLIGFDAVGVWEGSLRQELPRALFFGSSGLGLVHYHPAYKVLLAFVISIQVNNAFFYKQYLSAFYYVPFEIH